MFARFLPDSKEECARLKAEGAQSGNQVRRGIYTLALSGAAVAVSPPLPD